MLFTRRSYQTLLILLIFAGLAAISHLIPPFQSPDENVHLLRAGMISRGQWLLEAESGKNGREGGHVDAHLQLFANVMMNIAGRGVDKTPAPELVERADQVRWSDRQVFERVAGTGYYLPVIYVPHAIGLYASRQLNLSMRSTYTLTRGIVLFTVAAMVAWALSLFTPNVLMIMLLTTPMAMFQLSSPTIDGLCSAMALVAIGLWVHLSSAKPPSEGAEISWRELCLYGLILVLCTARTNLIPLLLVPLALLHSQFTRQRLVAVVVLYALTLGWIAFGVLTTYDHRVVRQYSTIEILLQYLMNPVEFIELLGRTVANEDIRRFYRDSFFGILGWLDTPIPRQAVRILAVVTGLTAVVLAVSTRWRNRIAARLPLLIAGVLSTILIFFALAVTWTIYPAHTISGVQGRYFLIPCLLMAAALGPMQAGRRALGRAEVAILAVFFAYSVYLLTSTLAAQYRMVQW